MYEQLRLSINYIAANFQTKISCDFISNMRATKRYSSGRCLEVVNSNFDPDTDYNSRGIPWFSSASPRKFRVINLGYATNASSKSKNLLISYPFIFYCAEIRAVLFLCFIHGLLLIDNLFNKLTKIVNRTTLFIRQCKTSPKTHVSCLFLYYTHILSKQISAKITSRSPTYSSYISTHISHFFLIPTHDYHRWFIRPAPPHTAAASVRDYGLEHPISFCFGINLSSLYAPYPFQLKNSFITHTSSPCS